MLIEFKKLPIPKEYGVPIFDVYYVIENSRTKVMEKFNSLPKEVKDLTKDLICRMATVNKFRSPKVVYNLQNYNFGEIKPMPHRFFFFQKCGRNYIFFEYLLKKKDSLGDDFYKRLNDKKVLYEEEFKRYMSKS